jgi:hypothetical protein
MSRCTLRHMVPENDKTNNRLMILEVRMNLYAQKSSSLRRNRADVRLGVVHGMSRHDVRELSSA